MQHPCACCKTPFEQDEEAIQLGYVASCSKCIAAYDILEAIEDNRLNEKKLREKDISDVRKTKIEKLVALGNKIIETKLSDYRRKYNDNWRTWLNMFVPCVLKNHRMEFGCQTTQQEYRFSAHTTTQAPF